MYLKSNQFKIICLIFSLFALLSCGTTKSQLLETVKKSDYSADEAALKAVLVDMWDAIEQSDIERYASHIHPDFTQFGEYDPVLLIGKQAEVEGVANWVANSKDIYTEMIHPSVHIKSEVAWITYYWKDKGETDGKSFSSTGKSTRIFVKENGKWLCIHGHYTLLTAE